MAAEPQAYTKAGHSFPQKSFYIFIRRDVRSLRGATGPKTESLKTRADTYCGDCGLLLIRVGSTVQSET